jgi:hypothetical protein
MVIGVKASDVLILRNLFHLFICTYVRTVPCFFLIKQFKEKYKRYWRGEEIPLTNIYRLSTQHAM